MTLIHSGFYSFKLFDINFASFEYLTFLLTQVNLQQPVVYDTVSTKEVITNDYKRDKLLRRIRNEAVRAHLRTCPLPQSISAPSCHLQP